jgi:glutamine synthetase
MTSSSTSTAAIRYLSDLLATAKNAKESGIKAAGVTRIAKEVSDLVDSLEETLNALTEQNAELGGDETSSKVVHMREKVIPAMLKVREVVDRLEKLVPDDLWPVPTYRDMLFVK